jgi:hypothetical protein
VVCVRQCIPAAIASLVATVLSLYIDTASHLCVQLSCTTFESKLSQYTATVSRHRIDVLLYRLLHVLL